MFVCVHENAACFTTDVQGTVNLLSSVAKTGKSVKRVVLTSSIAAMTPLSMADSKGPHLACMRVLGHV